MEPTARSDAPTVIVVDDDDSMRHALQRVLTLGGYKVRAFSSGEEFLADEHAKPAACLLLDVKMPAMDGLEVQSILNDRLTDLPVIFITGAAEVPIAVAAMKAGAYDFIEKPIENDDLKARVKRCIAAHAQRRQASDEGDRYQRGLAQLTPREQEVLELMLTGKTSKVIAKELDISHRTIEIHRARVMEKMQVETLAELVRMELSRHTSPL
jgi:two-component system, LuxR family, response regulator FixJ